jgi:hypothetical protein
MKKKNVITKRIYENHVENSHENNKARNEIMIKEMKFT